jgi:periplasmic protein TonB
MDLAKPLHLITKQTTMTNNNMMRANLLDIVFENRNKSYGAYELRKGYDKRLLTALGSGLLLLAGFILFVRFNSKQANTTVAIANKQEIIIREVRMPVEKLKQPEKPKEIIKPKAAAPAPKVAQVKYTTPVVKPDNKVTEPVKQVEDLSGKQIGNTNTDGPKDQGIVKQPPVVTGPEGNGTGNAGPAQPEQPAFIAHERNAEYPGGDEALKKFLGRYLNTPSSLEAGEKKTVKVRFTVGKDGAVSAFEIISSAGNELDNEVVRVCKKMPKWVPAIQNGINVPVMHILPVTFIGVEG